MTELEVISIYQIARGILKCRRGRGLQAEYVPDCTILGLLVDQRGQSHTQFGSPSWMAFKFAATLAW